MSNTFCKFDNLPFLVLLVISPHFDGAVTLLPNYTGYLSNGTREQDGLNKLAMVVNRGFHAIHVKLQFLHDKMKVERHGYPGLQERINEIENTVVKIENRFDADLITTEATSTALRAQGWTKLTGRRWVKFMACTKNDLCNADTNRAYCEKKHSMLASDLTSEDTTLFTGFLGLTVKYITLGGRSNGNGSWVWADGTPIIRNNWEKDHPGPRGNGRNCMELHKKKPNLVFWFGERCYHNNGRHGGFICEKKV